MKITRSLVYLFSVVLLTELALQVRSHVRSGQSVLNLVRGEVTYRIDPEIGIRMLAPNARIHGKQVTLESNRWGLRDSEFDLRPGLGEIRLAVLGASSVMGAFAPTNADTFPERLQTMLRERFRRREIEVINAGIAGLTPREQGILFQRRIAAFEPRIIFYYPGANDLLAVCRRPASDGPRLMPLPHPSLPEWWLTYDLIRKNTVGLRAVPELSGRGDLPARAPAAAAAGAMIEDHLNEFKTHVTHIASTLRESDITGVLVGGAYAFRPEMDAATVDRLAQGIHYYAPCLDSATTMQVLTSRDEILAEIAAAFGHRFVDMEDFVPGGERYFRDSSHFTQAGEQAAADGLLMVIERDHSLRRLFESAVPRL